jgi:hypothetical protein
MYKVWFNTDIDGKITDEYGGYYKYVGTPLDLESYTYYQETTAEIYKDFRSYLYVEGTFIKI